MPMVHSRRRVLFGAVALIAFQGVLTALYRAVESRRGREEHGFAVETLDPRPAPDVELVRPDGSVRRLSDRRGRAVLLHFWATWCVPCRAELPELLALGRELGGRTGLDVVAVATDQDWPAVREFFAGEVPPEVHLDPGGAAARAYEASVLPDSYVVTPDGAVIYRIAGARRWGTAAAREFIGTVAAPRPERRLRG